MFRIRLIAPSFQMIREVCLHLLCCWVITCLNFPFHIPIWVGSPATRVFSLLFRVFSLQPSSSMRPDGAPQSPALTPLSLAHMCAKYLQMQFRFKLNARSSLSSSGPSISASTQPPAPPLLLPVALVSELDHIVLTLVSAFLNPSK
jgi:hypothetical protein